jgi:hypothetical protein
MYKINNSGFDETALLKYTNNIIPLQFRFIKKMTKLG